MLSVAPLVSHRVKIIWRLLNLIIFMGWLTLLVYLILFVDPEVVRHFPLPNSYLSFFVLVSLTVGWGVGLVRGHLGKGLWWGLALAFYLGLRSLGLGAWWNAALILGLLIALEMYWHHPRESEVS